MKEFLKKIQYKNSWLIIGRIPGRTLGIVSSFGITLRGVFGTIPGWILGRNSRRNLGKISRRIPGKAHGGIYGGPLDRLSSKESLVFFAEILGGIHLCILGRISGGNL